MDVGQSLNPAIDVGQVEGAFVQGLGLFVTERVHHDQRGVLQSSNLHAYRIPRIRDAPLRLDVELWRHSQNRCTCSAHWVGMLTRPSQSRRALVQGCGRAASLLGLFRVRSHQGRHLQHSPQGLPLHALGRAAAEHPDTAGSESTNLTLLEGLFMWLLLALLVSAASASASALTQQWAFRSSAPISGIALAAPANSPYLLSGSDGAVVSVSNLGTYGTAQNADATALGSPILGAPLILPTSPVQFAVGTQDGRIATSTLYGYWQYSYSLGTPLACAPVLAGPVAASNCYSSFSIVALSKTGQLASLFTGQCGGVPVAWSVQVPAQATGLSTDPSGSLLFVAAPGTIYGLNSANGTLLWKYAATPNTTLGTPVVKGSLLVAADSSGIVHAINSTTGQLLWRKPGAFSDSALSAAPATFGFDGTIYISFYLPLVSGEGSASDLLWSLTHASSASDCSFTGAGHHPLVCAAECFFELCAD